MKRVLFILFALAFVWGNVLCAQELIRVCDKRTGLYGYKHENCDKWVVKPQYYTAGHFHEGLAYVIKKKGRQVNKWQYGNTRLPEGETKPRW